MGQYSTSATYEIPLILYDNDAIPMETGYFSAYANASAEGNAVMVSVYAFRPYPATVFVSLISGTATAGVDFSNLSYSYTIPAYTGFASFNIPTFDDSIYEGTESFKVRVQFMSTYSYSSPLDIPLNFFDKEEYEKQDQVSFLPCCDCRSCFIRRLCRHSLTINAWH